MKKIIICMISLVFLFALYITIDCIRLRNSEFGTKPIITIKEDIQQKAKNLESSEKYTGLGYTVEYTYYLDESSSDNVIIQTGKGAEFRVFEKIIIWAWIE